MVGVRGWVVWAVWAVVWVWAGGAAGWSEAWWDEGCAFACCSCCPTQTCRCALDSDKCRRPLWSSLPVAREKERHKAIVNYLVLGAGLAGAFLLLVSVLRDVPDLPRRTRAVNPMGHSEGSLCLLHAYQPPPSQAALIEPATLKLRPKPVSLVHLLPIRLDLGWLKALTSDSPPQLLPSPLDVPEGLEAEVFERKARTPTAGALATPNAAASTPGTQDRKLTFLPSELYLVSREWNDRCSVLTLNNEELDQLFN